jgi:hypothetical protein
LEITKILLKLRSLLLNRVIVMGLMEKVMDVLDLAR